MMMQPDERLEILRDELGERELALPVHSVRPHQLMAIETLEDEIQETEKALHRLGICTQNGEA